jgi:metal-responsive CopG/Arc/MetJ family transcriptional regulator
MKVKTSITLSKEILDLIEKNIEKTENRSRFIENAIRYYMKHYQQSIRDAKDLSIINENYQKLNKEAEEVLDFQDVAF